MKPYSKTEARDVEKAVFKTMGFHGLLEFPKTASVY
jgi:hypothetical protein